MLLYGPVASRLPIRPLAAAPLALLVGIAASGSPAHAAPPWLQRLVDAVVDRVADLGQPDPRHASALTPARRHALLNAAASLHLRDQRQWSPRRQPMGPRTAHSTNTYDELLHALRSGAQSAEGDVSVVRGVAVMRHDPRSPLGLTFRDWLQVMAEAKFAVVKVDVKRDKLGPILADLEYAVRHFGLKPERLKLNADLFDGPGGDGDRKLLERLYLNLTMRIEPEDFVPLRRAFPTATISVGAVTSKTSTVYAPEHLARFRQLANLFGGKVSFALRWDLVDRAVVTALRGVGQLDVWNNPAYFKPVPANAQAEAARLRTLGVDGVIDFGE